MKKVFSYFSKRKNEKQKLFTLTVFAAISILALAGCTSAAATPSEEMIQTAIAQTQTAMPTQRPIPSPTPIPLSEIDIERILLLKGDLPTIFEGGQVKNKIPEKFVGIPEPDQSIQQTFIDTEGSWGEDLSIMILIYSSISDLTSAYGIVIKKAGWDDTTFTPISDVGEKAVGASKTYDELPYIGMTNAKVIFSRCHALVYISLKRNMDVATTYAQRLDKRLKLLVCP